MLYTYMSCSWGHRCWRMRGWKAQQAAKQRWESTVKSRSHSSTGVSLFSTQQARSPSTGGATHLCAAWGRGCNSALLHLSPFHCQGGWTLLAPLAPVASSMAAASPVENSLQGKPVLESTGLLDQLLWWLWSEEQGFSALPSATGVSFPLSRWCDRGNLATQPLSFLLHFSHM